MQSLWQFNVQNYYDNYPEIIDNASPEIQRNLYNYREGCADARHIDSDSSPGASSIVDRIACQGEMDDLHCYNGGTLESSPTCRCVCQQGYFGENCEKSCAEERGNTLNIHDAVSYLDFCQ